MPRKTLLSSVILTAIVTVSLTANAQPRDTRDTEEAVLAPIHQLFDGMRAGDSTAVSSAFVPIARLVRTGNRDGVPSYQVTEVSEFASRVGAPHDEVWDERVWDIKTDVRDNLASVWMKFAFFAGDEFSHCGVNSAELVKTTAGWKIMHLADTGQRENCEMPPENSGE